jgi:hypothetical protein
MKRTIRLMTWLAVASAAPAVFAESTDRATKEEEASEKQTVVPTRADESAMGTADEGSGGGRGELPAQTLDRNDRADSGAADKRAQEAEAITQYDERKFLEEVWTRP